MSIFVEIDEPEYFSLYPYAGTHREDLLFQLIHDGRLPQDILFKLASIGYNEVDATSGNRLLWTIVQDLLENAETPKEMRSDTLALLSGDMPDGIIDWHLNLNERVRRTFDYMYYSVQNLATVIGERDSLSTLEDQDRKRISQGVAKGLWRAVVMRHHPEWLNDAHTYYAPRISFNAVHDTVTPRTMRSRILSRAVLSDPLIYETYDEATKTGVRGIANRGIESLRLLLKDEHPELL